MFQLKDKLTEDFLLLNADSVFDVDFNRFVTYHKGKGGLVTLFTHPNSHPYDSGLIVTDEHNAVQKWLAKEDERPGYYRNCVNAGLHILSPKVLEQKIDTPKMRFITHGTFRMLNGLLQFGMKKRKRLVLRESIL